VRLIVAGAAVAVAGLVTGVVVATAQRPTQVKAICKERPPVLLVPGVRSANTAAVKAAFEHSAKDAAQRLEPLARTATKDPVVQYNYGSALACAGYVSEAAQAYLAAKKAGRNTFYEMKADVILHPQYLQPQDGLYPIPELRTSDPLLIQGQLLQRQGHQHSAEKLYARAAKLHPRDDQAAVAAAVALFDESNLVPAFSHLGPLVERFPKSQSVRFHLGLLLAWTGQKKQAVKEFEEARALGPTTILGKQAAAFLSQVR
jgi:predicted Zn-dependent protease